jgi:hypothetical protein
VKPCAARFAAKPAANAAIEEVPEDEADAPAAAAKLGAGSAKLVSCSVTSATATEDGEVPFAGLPAALIAAVIAAVIG